MGLMTYESYVSYGGYFCPQIDYIIEVNWPRYWFLYLATQNLLCELNILNFADDKKFVNKIKIS